VIRIHAEAALLIPPDDVVARCDDVACAFDAIHGDENLGLRGGHGCGVYQR
jgi:hypothetical protein